MKEVSSSDCDYDHGSDSVYWDTAMVNMSCKIGKMFGRQECHTSPFGSYFGINNFIGVLGAAVDA